jgi:hypothetical protein
MTAEANGTASAVRAILGTVYRGCLALRALGTPGYCYWSASRTKPWFAAHCSREKMYKLQRPEAAGANDDFAFLIYLNTIQLCACHRPALSNIR